MSVPFTTRPPQHLLHPLGFNDLLFQLVPFLRISSEYPRLFLFIFHRRVVFFSSHGYRRCSNCLVLSAIPARFSRFKFFRQSLASSSRYYSIFVIFSGPFFRPWSTVYFSSGLLFIFFGSTVFFFSLWIGFYRIYLLFSPPPSQ